MIQGASEQIDAGREETLVFGSYLNKLRLNSNGMDTLLMENLFDEFGHLVIRLEALHAYVQGRDNLIASELPDV